MMTCRPSSPCRSATVDGNAAGSIVLASVKFGGAATEMTASGTRSGRHSAADRLAGSVGSHAKAQPPSVNEGRSGGLLAHRAGGDPAGHPAIIFPVIMIAPQEFVGEARPAQFVQIVGGRRGPPVWRDGHSILPSSWRAAPLTMATSDPELPAGSPRRSRTRCIERADSRTTSRWLRRSMLLETGFQQVPITNLRHPARSCQMAVMDRLSAHRLAFRIQSEDDPHHLPPVGAFLIGIKQPDIGGEVA